MEQKKREYAWIHRVFVGSVGTRETKGDGEEGEGCSCM
jgi:hypothetical protein